ncbi:2-epi-5-epi-valiolone synthase [Eubacterium plexicaudatum ASF492]|nr:2-epi-5-epi-valiolone synthase [Eubacterium plexicaudatum ASF492]
MGLDIYNRETFEPDKIAQSLKKIVLHRGGNINLVLPKELGEGIFVKNLEEISVDLLREAFVRLEAVQEKYKDGEIWV